MKKILKPFVLALGLTIGLSMGVRAQLPSERVVPLSLTPGLKMRMAQLPPASASGSLPSEGRNLPKVAVPAGALVPSGSKAPVLSIEERRKKLPSNAKNPAATLKKRVGG